MCMRWMCPPPRRIPLRFEPARALPVPFWRYIFLVEPATMPRDLVWCEPWRMFAWYMTIASCNSCLLMREAKSVGSTLYVPTFFPLRSYIVSFGMARVFDHIRCFDDDVAAIRSGDCAEHEQQVVFCVDLYELLVPHSLRDGAQL